MARFFIKIAFSLSFSIFFGANLVFAADGIYAKFLEIKAAPGSEFAVPVFVSVDETVNALGFEITYPAEILEFRGFDDGGSIIDLWQNKPWVVRPGTVRVEGGALNGIIGEDKEAIKILFKVLKSGTGSIFIINGKLYKADGFGTAVGSSPYEFKITANESEKLLKLVGVEDNTPPQLSAQIVKVPLSENQLVVFETKDKESGVKNVELRSRDWFAWSAWRTVKNPAELPKGVWVAEIRAVNMAGGETKTAVVVWNAVIEKIVIIGLGIVFAVFLGFFLYNRAMKALLRRNKI